MFSPAKKKPFPVVSKEYRRKRSLFSDNNNQEQQNESYRSFKLFKTVHKYQSPPVEKTTEKTAASTSTEISSSYDDSNSNKRQKSTKNRSKSFIDTHRNDYSHHQKTRLSDVSMNIKQNILNDIMAFSPIRHNTSPSPFILSDSDRQRLKKNHLMDSPHPKKFEVAQRESQDEHEQRKKSEFINKILYGDKVKKEREEENDGNEKVKQKSTKPENYKVQWITIDEIKKKNQSNNTHLPFDITPLKTSLSDLDTPRHPSNPFDFNSYKTPENNIMSHRQEDEDESNPFKESSTKITSFISKVTRRTSRKLRQSINN